MRVHACSLFKWSDDVRSFVLDCEIVYVDAEDATGGYLPFQEMDRKLRENSEQADILEIGDVVKHPKLLVFDVLALNDQDVSVMPLKYRKKMLAKTLNLKAHVHVPQEEKLPPGTKHEEHLCIAEQTI